MFRKALGLGPPGDGAEARKIVDRTTERSKDTPEACPRQGASEALGGRESAP
jgi:hypothetical protein